MSFQFNNKAAAASTLALYKKAGVLAGSILRSPAYEREFIALLQLTDKSEVQEVTKKLRAELSKLTINVIDGTNEVPGGYYCIFWRSTPLANSKREIVFNSMLTANIGVVLLNADVDKKASKDAHQSLEVFVGGKLVHESSHVLVTFVYPSLLEATVDEDGTTRYLTPPRTIGNARITDFGNQIELRLFGGIFNLNSWLKQLKRQGTSWDWQICMQRGEDVDNDDAFDINSLGKFVGFVSSGKPSALKPRQRAKLERVTDEIEDTENVTETVGQADDEVEVGFTGVLGAAEEKADVEEDDEGYCPSVARKRPRFAGVGSGFDILGGLSGEGASIDYKPVFSKEKGVARK